MHPIFGNNPGRVKDPVAAFAKRQSPLVAATYRDLMIEERAYRKQGTEKAVLTYDKSLERLQGAGFERHLRPHEAFGLLIDGLEGKLTGQHQVIYGDMHSSYGEWLNLAIERKGDLLVAYFDLVGLQWNSSANKYDVQGRLQYAQKKEYDVAGKAADSWISLEQFPSNFIEDMYSRPFAVLPEQMKTALVLMPLEGSIWPVCRGYYGFVIGNRVDDGASRGVHSAKKSP